MIVYSYPGYQIRFDLYLHSYRLGLRIGSEKKIKPGINSQVFKSIFLLK